MSLLSVWWKGVMAMPMQPKKPCRHPGCPNLTYDKYCEVHASVDRRASAHERGYTSKWRRLSKLYLKAHPLCEECKRQGKLTPATVVDHIVPHRGNEHLRWSESNWQSLCKPCHDKKTGTYDSTPKYEYNFWPPGPLISPRRGRTKTAAPIRANFRKNSLGGYPSKIMKPCRHHVYKVF